MKPVFYVLMAVALFSSCIKGKKLPHEVPVQFISSTDSWIYPEEYFSPFDPSDPDESVHYPNYVTGYSEEEIAIEFNDDLKYYLGKNNVILQPDTADYVLVISSKQLSESLDREEYIDSCSSDYSYKYVYYSSLQFQATAKLYKNGVLLDTWTKRANARETVKLKRDACNAPKIRKMFRGAYALIRQVSKEIRARVSRKIYELET